jgi:TRAP-type C4-dicarboxylate transport system substrate-binding protein
MHVQTHGTTPRADKLVCEPGLSFLVRALLLGLALFSIVVTSRTARAQPAKLRIALWMVPGSNDFPESPLTQVYRAWAASIEERSGDTIDMTVFYADNSDIDLVSKLRVGSLDGAVLTASGLEVMSPRFRVFSIPMLFTDADELSSVRSALLPELEAAFDAAGCVRLAWADSGTRQILSSYPIATLRDLRISRSWVDRGDAVSSELFRVLGINPLVVARPEVSSQARTGQINTLRASPLTATGMRWQPYFTSLTNLSFGAEVGALVIDKRALSRLSDEQRTIVLEASEELEERLHEVVQVETPRAIEALHAARITTVEPAQGLLEELTRVGRAMALRLLDRAWLARVDALLADYRAARP